jgi:hypothetical protein
MKHSIIATLVISCAALGSAQDSIIKPDCFGCPAKIIVRGKLARILKVSDCRAISGMTCRIQFIKAAALPSRIRLQEQDNHNKQIGKKFLIYPDLRSGEKGLATFRLGSPETVVVLTGEWKGPWRDEY